MTQEEKFLFKVICEMLPYGVKAIAKTHKGEKVGKIISVSTKNNIILGELYDGKEYFWLDYGSFKPYLRPLTSMTEQERNEYFDFRNQELQRVALAEIGRESAIAEISDWLLTYYFDYHGLIPMGLALPATEGMYNI